MDNISMSSNDTVSQCSVNQDKQITDSFSESRNTDGLNLLTDKDVNIEPCTSVNIEKSNENSTIGTLKIAVNNSGVQNMEERTTNERLSHSEMKKVFHKTIAQLLQTDPILNDLHPDMTYQEVCGLLEVEAGRSMLVVVQRADGDAWEVRVPRDATLQQLKAALRTHVTLHMHRSGRKRPISWRGVWRRYWLAASDGTLLVDDNATIRSLGVEHKQRLSFVKRERDKNAVKKHT